MSIFGSERGYIGVNKVLLRCCIYTARLHFLFDPKFSQYAPMSQKKNFKFDPSLAELASFHFALAHPARLYIVSELLQHKQRSFGELAANIPLHHSTVSQHITILRRIDLLLPAERSDGTTGYKLNQEAFNFLQRRYHLFSQQP